MSEAILLVDDEEMILDSLSAILEKEGYQVACARDGSEALALLKKKSFDLVITDIRMPGMSGLEMVEQVHGLSQQPKIMVITGYGSLDTAVKAQHRGVCDYLIKPINVQGLKNSIRRALQRDEKEQVAGTIPLDDKLRDWTEYFSLTSEFTASLNASLDVRDIMDSTLDRIKQIAETEVSSLYLFSRVICDLYYLKNISEMPAMSAGNGISTSLGDAIQLISGPILISAGDSTGRGKTIDAEHKLIHQAMERDAVRHALILPVTIKERVVGLVDICSFREQPFSDVDINILKTIVNQASIALAKSLSYLEMEERSKEISLLHNLSLRLNQSLKISDSIKAICEGAVDITGASGSLLQTSLEPGSIKNYIYHKDLGFHKEMRRGSEDWLIPQTARKEAFYSNDPVMDSRINSLALYSLGIRSLVYVPLIYEWEDLGGLTVFTKAGDRTFDERDIHLLHLFARHASEVLLNAQLFEAIKKSREKIITEKRKMDIILQHMADGVVTIAPDGRITYINEAMQNMLGIREDQAVGTFCHEIFNAAACPENCPVRRNGEPGDLQTFFETTIGNCRNESIAAYISLSPIRNNEGAVGGWVKLVKNIDKIKELEQLKDSFYHTIAHDLRAPLSSLMGFIEVISQNDGIPEKQREFLRIMQESASAMNGIINNLLDVHRSTKAGMMVKATDVDMKDLVKATIQEMDGMARSKAVTLSEVELDHAFKVRADSVLIKRVLNNLLSNAIKFTPDGGSVRLSAKQMTGEACSIIDTMREPGAPMHDEEAPTESVEPCLVISVEDTGKGLPPEELDRIFDRFYQARNADELRTSSSGLGLAISREIVEAHGGRIWAEQAQGGGTKFSFTLPLTTMERMH